MPALTKLDHPDCKKDREPASFFELTLSTTRFRERIQRWRDIVEVVWLWHKWHRAREKNFADVEEPEKIWLDYRSD